MPPFKEWLALSQSYHDFAAVIGWEKAIDFGMAVWERKKPPHREHGRGGSGEGGFIYIPTFIADHSGRELVELLGLDDALRIIDAFAGLYMFFPSIERASKSRRDREVAKQIRDGARAAVVACAFDLSERQVRRIARQESFRHAH